MKASPFDKHGVYALPRSLNSFTSTSRCEDLLLGPIGTAFACVYGLKANRARPPYIAHKRSSGFRSEGPKPNLPAFVRKNFRSLHHMSLPSGVLRMTPGGYSTAVSASSARSYLCCGSSIVDTSVDAVDTVPVESSMSSGSCRMLFTISRHSFTQE